MDIAAAQVAPKRDDLTISRSIPQRAELSGIRMGWRMRDRHKENIYGTLQLAQAENRP